jgi:hypothetical protein
MNTTAHQGSQNFVLTVGHAPAITSPRTTSFALGAQQTVEGARRGRGVALTAAGPRSVEMLPATGFRRQARVP